jgi:hypothetical protein
LKIGVPVAKDETTSTTDGIFFLKLYLIIDVRFREQTFLGSLLHPVSPTPT